MPVLGGGIKSFCFFWRIGEFLMVMLVFMPGGGGAAQWGGALLPIMGPPRYPFCVFCEGIDGAAPCGGRIPLNVLFCIDANPAAAVVVADDDDDDGGGGEMLLLLLLPTTHCCCCCCCCC